jgi:26S proteasome regulatory subunit N12
LDEDLEALKEVEALARGEEYVPVRKEKEALVMDSQAEMPLGRDGGRSSGEDEGRVAGTEEGKGGRQRKAWKKKGQKRTTRRVVMRPSVAKWVPETPWDVGAGSVSGEDGGDGGGGGGEADGDAGQKGKDNEGGDGGKEGKEPKARAAKKISATANPNFRTLNIKNKQSKGKRGGKFGRRR